MNRLLQRKPLMLDVQRTPRWKDILGIGSQAGGQYMGDKTQGLVQLRTARPGDERAGLAHETAHQFHFDMIPGMVPDDVGRMIQVLRDAAQSDPNFKQNLIRQHPHTAGLFEPEAPPHTDARGFASGPPGLMEYLAMMYEMPRSGIPIPGTKAFPQGRLPVTPETQKFRPLIDSYALFFEEGF